MPTCPLDQSENVNFFTEKNSHKIYRCQQCGLIFVWPLPSDAKKLYSKDYFEGAKNGFGYVSYEAEKQIASGTFNAFLDAIEKILPQRGKLLDVGTATGCFLEIAQKRGWEISGLEISQHAVDKACQKGLDVKIGELSDASADKPAYDAITFFDVFEHLPSPKETLQKAYNLLRQGGVVAINTPNSKSLPAKIMGRQWYAVNPPEHLRLFDADNLKNLLELSGFEIKSVCRIPKKLSLSYVLTVLANHRKSRMLKKASNLFSKAGIGSWLFPLSFKGNIFILAKKR